MAHFKVRKEFEEPVIANQAAQVDSLTGISGVGTFLVELVSFERVEIQRCPACGFSVHELVATGLLGCPACYDSLADTVRRQLGQTDLVS